MSRVLVHERKPRIEYLMSKNKDGEYELYEYDLTYYSANPPKRFITKGTQSHCFKVEAAISKPNVME